MALTSAGLTLPTTDELLAQIEADQAAALGDSVETGPASPLGQLNAVFANQVRVNQELAASVHDSFDPAVAAGAALERLCAITGTFREPATSSTVDVDVTVGPGYSYAVGEVVLSVAGAPDRRFVNTTAFENPLVYNAVVSTPFASEDTGPIEAPAGTLTVIAEPVAGIISATNPLDATLGNEIEEDPALRTRREEELSRPGTGTLDAIRVDLLDIGLVDVIVFENTTNTTDADGLPAHSIEILAYDGTVGGSAISNETIAAAVLAAKPAGIASFGTIQIETADSRGDLRIVNFTRPETQLVELEVTIVKGPDYTASVATAIESALVAYGQDNLRIGDDVVLTRLFCPISNAVEIPGQVYEVQQIRGAIQGQPLAAANIVLELRQLAVVDSGFITVIALDP